MAASKAADTNACPRKNQKNCPPPAKSKTVINTPNRIILLRYLRLACVLYTSQFLPKPLDEKMGSKIKVRINFLI